VLTYSYGEVISDGALRWRGFMNLRCARLLPLHVTTWLVMTCLHVWYGWYPAQGRHPLATWLLGLFCLQVYWPSADNIYRWNGQAWSIACELFFYACFPLLVPVLMRRRTSVAALSLALGGVFLAQVGVYVGLSTLLAQGLQARHQLLGYTAYIDIAATVLIVFPPLRLGEFVLGMGLALCLWHGGPVLRSRLAANVLLGGCLGALLTLVQLPWQQWHPLIAGMREYLACVPLLAILIVVLASGRTVLTPVLEHRGVVRLGEASYALYLLHSFGPPGPHPPLWRYGLCVGACVVASLVCYGILECPARTLWRKTTAKYGLG
jgi:peptidoglycan/LPS O-acetylase OafA/YrhL